MDAAPTDRRWLLKRFGQLSVGLAGLSAAGTAYAFWETTQIRIRRQQVALPHLPPVFVGKTIAVLADLHHGPFVSLTFIREAVRITNELKPDLVALVGDYAHKSNLAAERLPPCLEVLSALKAPLGVFAVPGNHDMAERGRIYHRTIASTPLIDVTNRSLRVTCQRQHLWIAGLDDLWWGRPDLQRALRSIPDDAAVVLLCHNPDFAEELDDERVGLMLSGHTHGGQIYLPGLSGLWVPSKYGVKYLGGLVQAPACQVFVSRGLGEAGVPLRWNCPPEINMLTLVAAG